MPMPGTRLSIRSLDDPAKEVPLGESGEICIAGPQVMKGYWQRPKETADAMVGEFLRTGDVGYMDAEGYTFIVDRIKDIIICSGFNVYPRRIEEAIYEFPGVEEVTVIGMPDDYRGEAPKAYVKLREGMTATQGRHHDVPGAEALQDRDAGRDRIPRRVAQDPDRQAVQEGAAGRDEAGQCQQNLTSIPRAPQRRATARRRFTASATSSANSASRRARSASMR